MINWLEKRRIISLILTILIAIEIFVFSSLTFAPGQSTTSNLSVIYHFTVFFLFSFFLLIAIKGENKINIKYLLIVFFISLLYSISDEFHQLFVPGRSAGINDIITDISGVISSILIYNYISIKSKK